MILYLLAGLGLICLTAILMIVGLLWYHNRAQARLLRDATKFLEAVERTSHGTMSSKVQPTERVGHA